jgi:hypothetical protein
MQLLILKQDNPAKTHLKGDVVEVRATGSDYGGRLPESFVVVEVPDLPMKDWHQYTVAWDRKVEFEVVSHDPVTDQYRIRLYSTTANAGYGEITKEGVEQYIQNWNGTVVSWGINEVVWDVQIFNALISHAFWETDISQIVFSEVSYDEATGLHRIAADYSATGKGPTAVERYVDGMGLTIVSHAEKVLTYDADSGVCAQILKRQINKRIEQRVARRRFHIADSTVDWIIGQGGFVTTDRPTLEGYLKDKVTE